MIKLTRSQLSKPVPNVMNIDVTIKSATDIWRQLAPRWDMVMNHKRGDITDKEYMSAYVKILSRAMWPAIIPELQRSTGHCNFQCYCKDGVFCHTHLLIDYLIAHYPNIFIDGRSL